MNNKNFSKHKRIILKEFFIMVKMIHINLIFMISKRFVLQEFFIIVGMIHTNIIFHDRQNINIILNFQATIKES